MSVPVSNNPAPTIESGNLSKDDILDLLAPTPEEEQAAQASEAAEEASPSKPAKPAAEDEDDEQEDEEVEIEEGDDEEVPDEEELNLVTPVRRKEILAKYPNLFKDFPYLQQAYYREQQFTEVFPTLDDAKEAAAKAEVLNGFETDLMQGNFSKVLGAVKSQDPEAFYKLADNYLQQLGAVDKDAVHHVIGNVLKSTIVNVIREASSRGDRGDVLKEAAILFHEAIFGTQNVQLPTQLSKNNGQEDNSEKAKLDAERQAFVREKFETARDNLNNKVQNSIKSTISNHIDPRQSMTDYVRKNATNDAQGNLEKLMSQDPRFTRIMDKLWEKAFQNNFSSNSLDQIRSTYLSKAKTLLPSVIRDARNEASKASRGPRIEKDRKGLLPIGGHSTPRSSNSSPNAKSPDKIPQGMKTIDFLNMD